MDTIVILHNSNSKLSRDFVATYGAGYQIINWYSTEADAVAYKSREMPYPRAFPSVVDTVQKLLVDTPATMAKALTAIDQLAVDKAAAEAEWAAIAAKISAGADEVNIADFDALIKSLDIAKDWSEAKMSVVKLAGWVGRLAEATGMTPMTSAAEVGL
jgi:hypothetical protein